MGDDVETMAPRQSSKDTVTPPASHAFARPRALEPAAVVELVRQLGLMATLRIGRAVEQARRRGEPFSQLAAVTSEPERLSRLQIGPAILLWRALREPYGAERAFAVTRAVVLAAGSAFLKRTFDTLPQEALRSGDEAVRRAFLQDATGRFFNASFTIEEASQHRVRFTAKTCHFPALCRAVDAGELAPLFCEVDAAAFGQAIKGVRLERPSTLATGGTKCPFTLTRAELP